MRNKIILLLVCFVSGITCLIIWVGFVKQDPVPSMAIDFLGYTNNASGTNLALFRISNEGKAQVTRWDIYQIEVQSSATHLPADSVSGQSLLRPGQSETVALLLPAHQGSWRAAFVVSNANARNGLLTFVAWLRAMVRGSGNADVQMHMSYSGWVS